MTAQAMKRLMALGLSLLLCLPASLALAELDETSFSSSRAKLLSYMLREQLTRYHYSQKDLDDALSRDAFKLYLTQLDAQKRYLLQKDVTHLRSYADRIDDELRRGQLELPQVGARLIDERIEEAHQIASELLSSSLNLETPESLETDPDKLDYAASTSELRERWRKILKFQINNRYLNLLEDEGLDINALTTDEQKQQARQLLTTAYEKVQKSNEDFFSRMGQETLQDYVDRYFNAVTRAFDPHTGYMPPTAKEDFDISMRGSLEGIGATLREEDGYIKVVAIIPGSAASRQGLLQPEDIILKVAQGDEEPVDVTDTRLRDAVTLIRGPKGSEVRLTVKSPDGTRRVIPIIRDVVQIEETFVKSAPLRDEPSGLSFGYIKVPSFYRDFRGSSNGGSGRNVTEDLKAELTKLKEQKVAGIILDLRNNGGGALTDAVSVTGLFIERGPVVQVRDGRGKTTILDDRDALVAYDGPLVVLVNRFSASASEIVAGALQDYGRAVIIGGDHTHGKGTVQAIVDLDQTLPFPNMDRFKPMGAMRVTIQKFYRINGESTQERGVLPDIVLPDRLSHLETGEKYMDYALPWDTVASTPYTPWPKLSNLEALEERSQERIKANEDFLQILSDVDEARKRREQTSQPLDQRSMWEERLEARLRNKEMPEHHDLLDDESPSESEKESDENWLQRLREDPYNLEAIAVLKDFISPPHQTVQTGQGG